MRSSYPIEHRVGFRTALCVSVVASFSFLIGCASVPRMSDSERKTWLAKRESGLRGWEGVQGGFAFTLFQPDSGHIVSESTGAFTVRRPDRVRWETNGSAREVAVRDGEIFWHLRADSEASVVRGRVSDGFVAEDVNAMALALLSAWYAPDGFKDCEIYLGQTGREPLGGVTSYRLGGARFQENNVEYRTAPDGVTLLALGFDMPQNQRRESVRAALVLRDTKEAKGIDPAQFQPPTK